VIPESNARKPAGHGCKDRQVPSKTYRSLSSSRSSGGFRSIIQCTVCSKTFNNSSALAKHKLIHSEERRYICNQCCKSFKRQDHLYVFVFCENHTHWLFVSRYKLLQLDLFVLLCHNCIVGALVLCFSRYSVQLSCCYYDLSIVNVRQEPDVIIWLGSSIG